MLIISLLVQLTVGNNRKFWRVHTFVLDMEISLW